MILFLIIVVIALALDLITKALSQGMDAVSVIPQVLTFIYAENTGASGGIFSDFTFYLTIFSILVVGAFLVFYFASKTANEFKKSKTFNVGTALIVAGALGNMVDRLFFGFVRDFIYIELFNFFPFTTIFNIADILINAGVVILIVYIFFIYRAKEQKPGVSGDEIR
ncbi:MAG: signal peptidase II [Firmicutes bacterium]|nr:signal peptidase II [Bacillota bacterium]